jgi:uncharacterized GH25 family protein
VSASVAEATKCSCVRTSTSRAPFDAAQQHADTPGRVAIGLQKAGVWLISATRASPDIKDIRSGDMN